VAWLDHAHRRDAPNDVNREEEAMSKEKVVMVTEKSDGVMSELKMSIDGHTASWQNYGYGECCASLGVRTHLKAGWLAIDSEEHGTHTSRRTIINLQRETALRLRDFLNAIYPEVRR
jgi:hypothetical protein